MKVLSLQKIRRKKHHVSYDITIAMEKCFEKNGSSIVFFSVLISFINKVFRKLQIDFQMHDITIEDKVASDENTFFIAMSYYDLMENRDTLRQISKKTKLGIYCFDVWEPEFDVWKSLFDEIKPAIIFFAYKNAKLYFEKWFTSIFVPQSMDSTYFYPRDVEKTRLFIQMGRRINAFHKMILSYMEKKGIPLCDDNYVYEKTKGSIIFPDTNELAENICRSKYFVAAPMSYENSLKSGCISDVTARFYEAMACKTLIIGIKPETFDDLFPHDAMVEVNNENFDDIINYYENNPSKYKSLVERNYSVLIKEHTWDSRYQQIISEFSLLN